MYAVSVNGLTDLDRSGYILPHEHIYIDITSQYIECADEKDLCPAPEIVGIDNLDRLSRDPYAVRDNLILSDKTVMEKEVSRFAGIGGRLMVDATTREMGRAPTALREISHRTGIDIVCGCGYYTKSMHPEDMGTRSEEHIAYEMSKELTDGIDDTGIRAGVIGEIGTSEVIYPDEAKVLRAAAKAHAKTGAGILVHTYPWGKNGMEAALLLLRAGADPMKICICHTDVELDSGYIGSLLDLGITVEFDNFGKEYYIDRKDRKFAGGVFARDIERVYAVRDVVEKGCAGQIMISNDICLKTMLHAYGGWGYDHIASHIVPMMEEAGISVSDINTIIHSNPVRFLGRIPHS
jgi:phosphotriesterase-related protein